MPDGGPQTPCNPHTHCIDRVETCYFIITNYLPERTFSDLRVGDASSIFNDEFHFPEKAWGVQLRNTPNGLGACTPAFEYSVPNFNRGRPAVS
jgi:hypothetical protein